VDPNVKLTIEPGVVVNFSNTNPGSGWFVGDEIDVNGSIDATGTAANPITFAYDGDADSVPTMGAIILLHTTGPSFFRHVNFLPGGNHEDEWIRAASSQLTVSDSSFIGNPGIIATGWPEETDYVDTTISNSRFDKSSATFTVPRGTLSLIRNSFSRGGGGLAIGLNGDGNTAATITDNTIARNDWFGLTFAASGSDWTASIRDNTISGNGINVYSRVLSGSSGSFDASGNNILGASQYNWFVEDSNGSLEYLAENNWWGSSVASEIAAGIHDHVDDPSQGTVDFTPFLSAPSKSAPPIDDDHTVGPPVPEAKISKVSVKGPSRAKAGRKVTYRVKVTNSGDATATDIRLKVTGKGIKKLKDSGTIGAGASKVIKIGVRPKKPGRRKLTFTVSSANGGKMTATKRIRVRR